MKKLLIIDDTLSNKTSYYLLVSFLICLPFDRFYSELILAGFFLHTAIHLSKKSISSLMNLKLVIISGVFFLTAITIIYTKNQSNGLSILSRQTAILALPFALSLNSFSLNRYMENLLWMFSITCTLVVMYLYFDAFKVIRFQGLSLDSLFSPAFINHNFSLPIGIHATYLSMYVALCAIFLVQKFFTVLQLKTKIIISLCVAILCAGLIQLASRAVLVAFFLVLVIIPFFFLDKKLIKKYALLIILPFLVCLAFIFLNPNLKDRYLEQLGKDLGQNAADYSNATPRTERWKLALELIKESPLIGYGAGDETDLLSEKYFDHKFYTAYLLKLNSHSEYISFLIRGGFIGLIFYLYILYCGFRTAFKRKSLVFFGFMSIIATVSFSENLLDVNKGIFFFAFFFSVFMLQGSAYRTTATYPVVTGNQIKTSIVFNL